MAKKVSIIIAILWLLSNADVVILSSGKEVSGKIRSYSALEGLKIQADYGLITIKSGDIVSYQITNDSSSVVTDAISQKDSELNKLGLFLNENNLLGYKISFDSDNLNAGKTLVELTNIDKGFFALIGKESMGIEPEKYLDMLIESRKSAFQNFSEGKSGELTKNGIKYFTREIDARIKGQDITYFFATFIKNEINFRFVFWTYPLVYEKHKDEPIKILNAISIKK
jgi:hypothetical protein